MVGLKKMPDCAWVCFRCAGTNAAGTDSCRSCGFSASARGEEIAKARAATENGQVWPPEALMAELPASLRKPAAENWVSSNSTDSSGKRADTAGDLAFVPSTNRMARIASLKRTVAIAWCMGHALLIAPLTSARFGAVQARSNFSSSDRLLGRFRKASMPATGPGGEKKRQLLRFMSGSGDFSCRFTPAETPGMGRWSEMGRLCAEVR
jgi:hypothetical protein